MFTDNLFHGLMSPAQQDRSAAVISSGVSTAASRPQSAALSDPKEPFDYFGTFMSGLQEALTAQSASALEAEKAAAKDANDFTYRLFTEGNEFNAEQAKLAFEREQTSADKAMAFEKSERLASEAFYERLANSSYQRAVEDLKAAGLNPALAYSQGGSASAMSSGASGSTANASAASSQSGSSAKAAAASAKNADTRLLSSVMNGVVTLISSTLTSAVKLVDSLIPG